MKMLKDMHQKVHEIWENNAAWWDQTVGEGNAFQTILIGPATEDLLSIKPGELILDIACGSGIFSRRMACLGADVVAFDFSENFLACAVKRTTEYADKIEYILNDAQVKIIIVSNTQQLNKILEIQHKLTSLTNILIIDGPRKFDDSRILNFWQLLEKYEKWPLPPKTLQEIRSGNQQYDIASIIYTSGTTGEPVTISATITDDVGVVSATVHYTPIDGTETTVSMTEGTTDVWSADVPVAEDKVGTITYYITAQDAAGNPARDPTTGSYSITVTDNDAPTADAGPDQSVPVDETVYFDGYGSSDNIGITSYSWDWSIKCSLFSSCGRLLLVSNIEVSSVVHTSINNYTSRSFLRLY